MSVVMSTKETPAHAGTDETGMRDLGLLHFSQECNADFVERCVTHAIKNVFYDKMSQLYTALDV